MAATVCDFVAKAAFSPGMMERFLANPNSYDNLLHFTKNNEFDIYDEVDPSKKHELSQSGQVVVITGGGRGIGRGIAVMFARAKAKAIGICARTLSELAETQQIIKYINPHTTVYVQQVDVASQDDVHSFFNNMTERFGIINVAVSNAATMQASGPTIDTDITAWWNDQTVGIKGAYLVSRYFGESLDGKSGTLVNISSVNALATMPYQGAYSIAKLAVARMIETIHLETPNIRCFSLHPGVVETEMVKVAARGFGVELNWQWTNPALVGAVILWLTTSRAEFLRGRWFSANWRVDELEALRNTIEDHNLLKTAFNAQLGL